LFFRVKKIGFNSEWVDAAYVPLLSSLAKAWSTDVQTVVF
jgi:hypothetical protein